MSVLFYFYCTKLMKQKASVDNNDFLLSRNFHVYFYYFFLTTDNKTLFSHFTFFDPEVFLPLFFILFFFNLYFFFSTSSTAQLCLRLKTYNYELTFTFSWPFINHISISSFFSFLLFLCFCISLPWNSI